MKWACAASSIASVSCASSQARPASWRARVCSSSSCASMRASPRVWAWLSAWARVGDVLVTIDLIAASAGQISARGQYCSNSEYGSACGTHLQLFELFGLAGVGQGLQHIAQVAFHHLQQLVQREVDAVVREPPLREVVGADAVAAVAAADQALAQSGLLGGAFAALLFLDTCLQHLQRLGLVAVLAAAVLAFGHDAGGQVDHTHGRIGLVDVLATGAAGAEGVDAQVCRVELDGLVLVG